MLEAIPLKTYLLPQQKSTRGLKKIAVYSSSSGVNGYFCARSIEELPITYLRLTGFERVPSAEPNVCT